MNLFKGANRVSNATACEGATTWSRGEKPEPETTANQAPIGNTNVVNCLERPCKPATLTVKHRIDRFRKESTIINARCTDMAPPWSRGGAALQGPEQERSNLREAILEAARTLQRAANMNLLNCQEHNFSASNFQQWIVHYREMHHDR